MNRSTEIASNGGGQQRVENVLGNSPQHGHDGISSSLNPVHGSLRTDESLQPTGREYFVAQRFAEAKEYGAARGALLAEMLRQGGGRDEANRQELAELDRQFAEDLALSRELFVGEKSTIAALVDSTRVAQDRALYDSLKKRYFDLGVELGETQGKHIEVDKHTRSVRRLDILNESTTERIGGDLTQRPLGVAEARGESRTRDLLVAALNAASSQGERAGIDRRISAEIDAAELYRAVAGWKEYLPTWFPLFKPFHVVHSILSGKSRKQLEYIDASMRERCGGGVGLREALVRAYGQRYERRIEWLVGGDQVGSLATQAARGVRDIISTRHSRGEGLRGLYEQIPAESLGRFERLLAQEVGVPHDEVKSWIESRVTEKAARKLDALRKKDIMLERVLHVEDLLDSKPSRQLELRKSFRKMAPSEVAPFCALYKARFGRDLRSDIAAKVAASPAKDLCLAVLDNDTERIMAAKVRCAFMYRADFIGSPFLNTSQEERQPIWRAYEKHYCTGHGGLLQDLRQASWREDYFFLSNVPVVARALEHLHWPSMNSYPFLESIVLNGELSPAELLRYFMVGVGTDIEGIYAVLSDCTKKEIEAIESEYARRYAPGRVARFILGLPLIRDMFLNGDLRHDLKVELSGDHEFDISMYMEGLPEGSDERVMCKTLLDRLIRRFRHEQSGPLMRLRNGILSHLRGDGRVVKQFMSDYVRAVDYYRDNIEHATTLSAAHIKRFSTLVRIAETQADAYREAKVAISNLVLNSGAAIGATLGATSVILISALPWWSGPFAAGLGSLTWRWVQGRLVLGKGFGTTDATFQALRAFIDGASMFTIKLGVATLSGLLGRQLSSAAAKGGFKTSLHKFIKKLEDGIKRQNKARHVLEQGDVLDSDAQLEELSKGFYREIEQNPRALCVDLVTEGRSVEHVIQEALRG
jgi:hypothetical protein